MLYQKSLMDKWDAYSVLKTAEEKGMEKGMERGKEQFVKNLITQFSFTDEQAANAAEVSVDFVKKIRAALKRKK
ncbi:hypothetical protein [Niabella drilacis]|nr:hypothetical protein [Niabella drilacis]